MTQSNVHHFCHFFILSPSSPIWISSKQLECLYCHSHLQWVEEWWGCLSLTTHCSCRFTTQENVTPKHPSNFPLWKFWQCKLCQDQSKNNKLNKHNTEARCPHGVVHHGASWAGQQCHQQIFHQWCPKNFSAQLLLHANHDPKCCWCFLHIWSQLECEWKRYTNFEVSGLPLRNLQIPIAKSWLTCSIRSTTAELWLPRTGHSTSYYGLYHYYILLSCQVSITVMVLFSLKSECLVYLVGISVLWVMWTRINTALMLFNWAMSYFSGYPLIKQTRACESAVDIT